MAIMGRVLYNLAVRVRNLVIGFVPIVFAAIIAAVNTATDKSPKGYAAAILTALATVFVSPAFQRAELKAKIVPPDVESLVAARVKAALRARAVIVHTAPPAPVIVARVTPATVDAMHDPATSA